jgi:hypothetical protein
METKIDMGNRKFKLGLLLPILILVALFAAFWAASIIYQPLPQLPQRPVPQIISRYDFEFFYIAHAIFSTIYISLLIVLVITYVSIYTKTKSEFSFGLIIFAGVFLLKDLSSSPFVSSLFTFYAYGLGPFAVLPDLFEFAALTVLVYLSIKY